MAFKIFTQDNLSHLWVKLKAYFVAKEAGKGLSTNDFTDELAAKLNGIEDNANNYSHPAHTSYVSGFYKVTVDAEGHVVGATAVSKEDVVNLGIPAQDTVYSHPAHSARTAGIYKITVDAEGHVSEATLVTKQDLVNMGLPAQDTTYGDATATAKGLVTIGENVNVAEGKISVANGSTAAKGVVKLSDAVDTDDSTLAATSKAVKAAYDLATSKQSPATSLAGYGITDAYTKTEVDGLVSGALHYKGTKDNFSELPASGNKTGDVWNIKNADVSNGVNAGDNVAWNGEGWDILAGTVDLSAYLLASDVTALTNEEIDAILV